MNVGKSNENNGFDRIDRVCDVLNQCYIMMELFLSKNDISFNM